MGKHDFGLFRAAADPHLGVLAERRRRFFSILSRRRLERGVVVGQPVAGRHYSLNRRAQQEPQTFRFQKRADVIAKLVERLTKAGRRLSFCYEAGPCGYGLHRFFIGRGQACIVVAPSLIPMKAGDRIKTDRRDAVMLAKLHRASELTPVWVPDSAHEAMQDLVRARATAVRGLGKARQHLQGFLLKHGLIHAGKRAWTLAYRRWLTTIRFDHAAQQIVLQDYIHAVQEPRSGPCG